MSCMIVDGVYFRETGKRLGKDNSIVDLVCVASR